MASVFFPVLAVLPSLALGARTARSTMSGSHLEMAAILSAAKPWILEKTEATDAAAAAAKVNPVVFVPGITSSALTARRRPDVKLGNPRCESVIPKTGWYPLYVSARWAGSPGCFLWQMQLQPPKPSKEDPEKMCVEDAPGIMVEEVGFGTTTGNEILNPGDLVPFRLYEEMIRMFEGLGLTRGVTVRFATYDWRKFGDQCWEERWFAKLVELVENTVHISGKPVTLGCHSMGCPLSHLFLNSVSAEWKRQHIHEFVATAPSFAGAPATLQNFIEGPTLDTMPLIVANIGRATMTSMPAFYALLPTRIGDTWPEEQAIISTPWENFTIGSVYDGHFFDEVEAPEETPGAEKRREIDDFQARSQIKWDEVREGMSKLMTDQGCVCSSECTTSIGAPVDGVYKHSGDWAGISRPWCYTIGKCGTRTLRLRLTINIFKIINVPRWDFCGGDSKPIDAGPGFEFFPGVTTEKSNVIWRLFGVAESYSRDTTLQIEEQKERCLEKEECTGFDTLGYLKRGKDYRPDTSWRGIKAVQNGIMQGLYMKRPDVLRCQLEVKCDRRSSERKVCGSDGKTYESQCFLEKARCGKPDLKVKHEDPCKSSYMTPQGCRCVSSCGDKKNTARKEIKGCYVEGQCGFTSSTGKRWDTCMDADGIDTGRGFEYFPRTYLPPQQRRPLELRSVGWFEAYHVDKLQEECGRDPACAGFSTEGYFFTKAFADSAAEWKVSSNPNEGLFRKRATVLACQRECNEIGPHMPICHMASRMTFPHQCAAENYRCLKELDEASFQLRPGPCRRRGDVSLHSFAQRHLERMSRLMAPGVPTVCMWISDVDTGLSWRYDDFLSKGENIQMTPGDGTVNAQSAEGPCQFWKQTQSEELGQVQLMRLKLGGASHVDMLWTRGFLDALKRVLLKDELTCPRVDGALVRNSEDVPLCKCAEGDAKVRCNGDEVAGRKFDLTEVLAKCPTPVCAV